MTDRERAFALLKDIVKNCVDILRDNLVGVYAHGSLTLGCFCWQTGDLDFLIVVQREMTQESKEGLIRYLLRAERQAPLKGLEMSVMLREHCRHFSHPAPYELHYSKTHRQGYENDLSAYCQRMQGRDVDLAAHCMVVRTSGQTLYGEPIEAVFGEVPKETYVDSILADIENAVVQSGENPVYITLNLCRVLAYLQEGRVLSKAAGGVWGVNHVAAAYAPVIQAALNAYSAQGSFEKSTEEAQAFAAYMLQRINDAK